MLDRTDAGLGIADLTFLDEKDNIEYGFGKTSCIVCVCRTSCRTQCLGRKLELQVWRC